LSRLPPTYGFFRTNKEDAGRAVGVRKGFCGRLLGIDCAGIIYDKTPMSSARSILPIDLKGEIALEFLLGLLIFIADVWAIVKTVQSPASGGTKLLWVLIILILPLLGLILWFFLGPQAVRA
jgi:hypothetical protein